MLTLLQDLEQALAAGPAEVTWLVTPSNWFELVPAARLCAAAGVKLDLQSRDAAGVMPLATVPIVDFAAAYEVVREWWRDLAGDQRPSSLSGEAHGRLVEALRDEVFACSERLLNVSPPPAEPATLLTLPGPGHVMLAEPPAARRFWEPFLTAAASPSLHEYTLATAHGADAAAQVRTRPWLRLLLQHELTQRWQPELRQLLVDTYGSGRRRTEMLRAERRFCAEGLEWLCDRLAASLGLAAPARRSKPFAVPAAPPAPPAKPRPARVTVLIPSYRHEAFIEETIRSVLAQSLRELQVLVVDDHSPDATVERARAIGDPRLTVHTNDRNLGLGNSVLGALDRITTPYVALLNSDDLFHPERLTKCLAALDREPQRALVGSDLALIDHQGRRLTPQNASALFDGRSVSDWVTWYDRIRPRPARGLDLFGELLERNFLATSSNIVCRTDWLRGRATVLRSLKYCLDWQLFLDAARTNQLVWLPEELIAYRLHPNNTVWFAEDKRWVYSIEVNRVATTALREHIDAPDADPERRAERAVRAAVDHLQANTETDWTGLYLNELVGGLALDRQSAASPAVGSGVAELAAKAREGPTIALGAERRRAELLAIQWRVARDRVYALQGLAAWQRERIETDGQRLREQADQLGRAQTDLTATAAARDHAIAELATSRSEHGRLAAALADLRQQADATVVALTAAKTALEASEAELKRCREVLEQARHEREQARIDSAHARGELAGVRSSLDTVTQQLRGATESMANLARDLELARAESARIAAELERVRTDLAQRTSELAVNGEQLGSARRELASTQAILVETTAKLGATEDHLAETTAKLGATEDHLAETTAKLGATENHLAETTASLRDARTRLGVTTESLASTATELAGSRLDHERTRHDLASAQRANQEVQATLQDEQRAREGLAADLGRAHAETRRLRQETATDLRRLREAQHTLAIRQAAQLLDQQAAANAQLHFRGTLFRPGATTLALLRRLAKWRRKLGAVRQRLLPRWLSYLVARPVLLTATCSTATPRTLPMLAAEAGARLLHIAVRDGNLPALARREPTMPDTTLAWSFPEHHRALWRRFERSAPERCKALRESIRASSPAMADAWLPHIGDHLVFALAAQRQRAALLCAEGNLSDLARTVVAATVLGRPWLALVEHLDAGEHPLEAWAVQQLPQAGLVIARSAELRAALLQRGVPGDRIVVQSTATPTLQRVAGDTNGPLHVLALGPLLEHRGWEEIVVVVAALRDRGLDVRLRIAGDLDPSQRGSLACLEQLRAMAPAFGVPTTFEVPEDRRRARPPVTVDDRTVLVAPWTPPNGPAAVDGGVLAAMAAGLPILGSDIAPIAAAVRHEHEALLVPAADTGALVEGLHRLSEDAALRVRLGRGGQQRFTAEFAETTTRAELGARVRLLLVH